MKWRITHCNYPDGNSDSVICSEFGQVWAELNGLKIDGKFPLGIQDKFVEKQMEDLWGGGNPLHWMKLYNDNVTLPGEYLIVWDLEEDKSLLD